MIIYSLYSNYSQISSPATLSYYYGVDTERRRCTARPVEEYTYFCDEPETVLHVIDIPSNHFFFSVHFQNGWHTRKGLLGYSVHSE